MKRAASLLIIALVISLIFVGCAKPAPAPVPAPTPAPTPTPAPAPTPPWSPTKTITWMVPHAPGGGFDTYSRAIARVMEKDLGVTIVIKNIPGAGSRTGTIFLNRSKPDGHTFGIINLMGLIALDVIEKSELYDLSKFTWLGQIGADNNCFSVSADSPFQTLEDLQKAEKVKFADVGAGTSGWVIAQLAKGVMKIPMLLVTGYTGSGACIVAVLRGDADVVVPGGIPLAYPYIKAGDLRAVLQFTIEPDPLLPDVPTLKGTGYEELEVLKVVRFIAAPPGTPKEIADVLEASLMKAIKGEELQKWSKDVNRPIIPATGAEAAQIVKSLSEILSRYEAMFK